MINEIYNALNQGKKKNPKRVAASEQVEYSDEDSDIEFVDTSIVHSKRKLESDDDYEFSPKKTKSCAKSKHVNTTIAISDKTQNTKLSTKKQAKKSSAPKSTKPGKTKSQRADVTFENVITKSSDILQDDTKNIRLNIEAETAAINCYPSTSSGNSQQLTLEMKKRRIKSDSDNEVLTDARIKQNYDCDDIKPLWSDYEWLSEQTCVDTKIAKNLVKLFEEGNTIPFMARYRRDVIGNLPPETLRDIKERFDNLTVLKTKMKTVVKAVEKVGKLDKNLRHSIIASKTFEELEHIYAPFKPGTKRTLAERAIELGLEETALVLLSNSRPVNLSTLVDTAKKDLGSIELVEKGISHIIASKIATDVETFAFLRKWKANLNCIIETKKAQSRAKVESKDKNKPDESKYENYFKFNIPVKFIKPHQVLAINRGESRKILSVKIVIPEFMFKQFNQFCTNKWVAKGPFNHDRNRILKEAIKDSYNRLVHPFLVREIRAELKQKAIKASNEVFCTNLKHLLLTSPLRGKAILAMDPGFTNGVKIALVSTTGQLMDYAVIFPNERDIYSQAAKTVKKLLFEHNCEIIAIGNGTACRNTEIWVSSLIQKGIFRPLNVRYTIVNEDGASIYSCSPEAKKEFVDLDPNIISAVSLARRVQDPLAELVKIEPKHLGIGMYQHDLKKKQLEESLDEVVSECVSFVGVDLNTASQCLLRRIAGLTDKKATHIIEYREKNGPFTYRKQLMDIKGIGSKAFEQCAGFLRVGPADAEEAINFYKKPNTTKLDRTYIHPESYSIARKIMKKLHVLEQNIGDLDFIRMVNERKHSLIIPIICEEMGCTEGTVSLILESLTMPLNYDCRSESDLKPFFKSNILSLDQLYVGLILTGVVKNVTHFGCFVDLGVGKDGLLHSSEMNGLELQIGHKVEVKIIRFDISKNKISLTALKKH